MFVILFCRIGNAQNLVPNPSFEDTTSCPITANQINHATGWTNYRGSPEYLNSCNNSNMSVPLNSWGFQQARTGNAYAGIATFDTIVFFREYIGIQLVQSLVIGQKYFASFYACKAVNSTLISNPTYGNVASNKLGLKLSTVSYTNFNPQPTNNYAQVFTNLIITDTLNWVRISGNFIADSIYQYLSIGNFFNDSNTAFIATDSNAALAYYYIDDVVLSTDSLFSVGLITQDPKTEIMVYPNPFNNRISISLNNNIQSEIALFDILSRIVLKQTFTHSITIATDHLVNGLYIYEVRNKNGTIMNGKVIKH